MAHQGSNVTRVKSELSLTDQRSLYEQALANQPTTARCAWCDWTFHGSALEAIQQGHHHRQVAHNIQVAPKKRHRPANAPVMAGDLEANIANARAQGAAAWTASTR